METFSYAGLSKIIHLDAFSAHKSQLMRAFADAMGVTIEWSTPYHKTGNAAAERGIGVISRWIESYLAEYPNNWDEALSFLLLQHKEMVNVSLGFSPAEIVFFRQIHGPLCLTRVVWENPDGPKPARRT